MTVAQLKRFVPLAALGLVLAACGVAAGEDTRVVFDIPSKIECRDVTPAKCAEDHPHLKVIEAKFRISASFIHGAEESIVNFAYIITSPELRMKIQDYLPNTTLESTLADDHIEVADTTESSTDTGTDAHAAYTILSLGGSRNTSQKQTKADHYKRIVPKALVLASGTTNREHGVFFKLRPSKEASLEGGKEFTFLAIVPKTWRGDWCSVVCAARASRKSFLSSSVTTLAGVEQAHVGLYLTGDSEASALAESLCQLQEANNGALSKQMAKEAAQQLETMHATAKSHHALALQDEWLHHLLNLKPDGQNKLKDARQSLQEVQDQLSRLSGAKL